AGTSSDGAGGSQQGTTVGAGLSTSTSTLSSTTTTTTGTSSSDVGSTTSAASTSSGATTSASTTSASSSSSTGGGGDPTAAQMCVDFINQKRATLGLAPYARWNAEESCASGEAQTDYGNNQAHSAFPSCGEWAQNECPGWPGTPESIIENCLQMMWDEGP